MAPLDALNLQNPVLRGYLFYTAILMIKMLCMAFLTGYQRSKKAVYANPEDAKFKKGTIKLDDPDVERVRRAHQNDIENILVFVVAGFIYILTNPSITVALNLFRSYTAARILHTVVYAVKPQPQPSRFLCFAVGMAVTLYMLGEGIKAFI